MTGRLELEIYLISMLYNKKKQKTTIDKEFQEDIKEVKSLLNQGKALVERATSEENFRSALDVLTKAIEKTAVMQVVNNYLLYYYRGTCFMRLKQLEKAERDFMEGLGLADDRGRIQLHNSLGRCKIEMATQDPSYLQEAIKSFEKSNELSKNSDGEAYMNLGDIYKWRGNHCQAISEYSSALKNLKTPDERYQVLMSRGLCYRETEQLDPSSRDFMGANKLKKAEPMPYFHLAVNSLKRERYEEALESLEYAIEMDCERPEFYNCKGLVLYEMNQFDPALTFFKEATRCHQSKGSKGEDFAESYYHIGNCLLKLNREDQAMSALEIAQQTSQQQSLQLKITYSQGLISEKKGDTAGSTQQFRSCLDMIGQDRGHELYQASLYHLAKNLHLQKQYHQSLECLASILKTGCKDKCVMELRGRIYLDSEAFTQALRDFQFLLQLDKNDPSILFYLGVCKTQLGDLDSAIADFLRAMELGSRDVDILNGICCAYLRAGQPKKALVYANIVLQQQSSDKFLIQRAMVFIELGDFHKSIQDLTTAVSINASDPFSLYQRGISYYKSKQFELAIKDLTKSLELNPSPSINHHIHYLIGISHSNLEQFESAIEPLTCAIEAKPIPKYYHERSKCFLLLNSNREALDDLNQVIEEQPENAFAYFRRGLVFKALKDYEEAAENFIKARELSPDDPRLMINRKQIYEIKYRKLCEAGEEM